MVRDRLRCVDSDYMFHDDVDSVAVSIYFPTDDV